MVSSIPLRSARLRGTAPALAKHDALMERVDAQGHIIGFSIMDVSRFKKDKPLEADLASA